MPDDDDHKNDEAELEYWRTLAKSREQTCRDIDKTLLTFSSSGIGLILYLFISDNQDSEKLISITVFIPVILFIICIIAVLTSNMLSFNAHDHKLKELSDSNYQHKGRADFYDIIIRFLNVVSYLLFIGAIMTLCLIIFITFARC